MPINPTEGHKVDIFEQSLEWAIEATIMEKWPEFAFAGATQKAVIISDIHGRFVNNRPLWSGLTPFVYNYVDTIVSVYNARFSKMREIFAEWGSLLTLLNVG